MCRNPSHLWQTCLRKIVGTNIIGLPNSGNCWCWTYIIIGSQILVTVGAGQSKGEKYLLHFSGSSNTYNFNLLRDINWRSKNGPKVTQTAVFQLLWAEIIIGSQILVTVGAGQSKEEKYFQHFSGSSNTYNFNPLRDIHLRAKNGPKVTQTAVFQLLWAETAVLQHFWRKNTASWSRFQHRDPQSNIHHQTSFSKPKDSFRYLIRAPSNKKIKFTKLEPFLNWWACMGFWFGV